MPELPGDPLQAYERSPGAQRRFVALALFDSAAYGQLGPRVFDAGLVTHPPLRYVAEEAFRACADNGGQPPSGDMVEELVRERARMLKPNMAAAVLEECRLVLETELTDAQLVRAKAAEWAREAACEKAVLRAAELIEGGAVREGRGRDIVRLIEEATTVGQSAEASVRIVGDEEAVLRLLTETFPRTRTDFPALDEVMNGGATPGLHVIAADPKLGKTAFLTQVAVGGARQGLTVLVVSGEVTLGPMVSRTVRAMTGRGKAEILSDPRGVYQKVRAYRQTRGEIICEYFPGFTPTWLASRVRQLELRGYRIGLVVADYVDLMRIGGREFTEMRHEQAEICRQLRALAVEMGVPCWTAKAVNRMAVAKPVVTKKDLAECFAVAYIADNILAICATEEERRSEAVYRGQRLGNMIIRLFYAAGREDSDERMVAAYERDNDRQRWRELPGYLEEWSERQRQRAAGAPQ